MIVGFLKTKLVNEVLDSWEYSKKAVFKFMKKNIVSEI